MKKFSATLLLVITGTIFLFGKQVQKSEALAYGKAFLTSISNSEYNIQNVIEHKPNGILVYYVLELQPKGWIMVSSDDEVQPILGYSLAGNYVPYSQMNNTTRKWIDSYSEQIELQVENNQGVRNSKWDLDEFQLKGTVEEDYVNPLIKANWAQGEGWNRYCPEDLEGPGGHAVVGCVALAMGQAMKVFNYPEKPRGKKIYSHKNYGIISVDYNKANSYDWSNMNNTYSDKSNTLLLYHLAVSVNMKFGNNGSGAYPSDIAGAMKNYFGYSNIVRHVKKSNNKSRWNTILKNELKNGYPIIYYAADSRGILAHAFNIDGYRMIDNLDYYHINWGWGGELNGYFTISPINVAYYTLSIDHGAIIGIRPPKAQPTDVSLSNTKMDEFKPVGTYLANVNIKDDVKTNVYNCEIFGAKNPDGGYFPSKFYLENGKLYNKEIISTSDGREIPVHFKITDMHGNYLEKNLKVTIYDKYFEESFLVYPNPVKDRVFIGLKTIPENGVLTIFDGTGKIIEKFEIEKDYYIVDLSNFSGNIYFVNYSDEKNSYTRKIIKY